MAVLHASREQSIPNRGPGYNAAAWVLCGISIVAVVLRLLTRTRWSPSRSRHTLGFEDMIMVVAILINIAATVLFSVSIAAGTGRHLMDIPRNDIPRAILLNITTTCVAFFAATLPKISIALLEIRIFAPKRLASGVLLGFAIIENLTAVIITIWFFTICSPPAGIWNPFMKSSCPTMVAFEGFSIFASAWSGFLDLVYGIFPCVRIARLQMSLRKKLLVSAAFAAGCFACGTQVYKSTKLTSISAREDYTWAYGDLLFWTMIQVQVITIAACVPTLRPAFKVAVSQFSSMLSLARSMRNDDNSSPTQGPNRKEGTGLSDSAENLRPTGAEAPPNRITKSVELTVYAS